jgi:uncharacterized protein YjeT (DUF2065 family)
MWHDLLAAVALVLVIEGIMPFLNPAGVRRALLLISQMSDSTLRFVGLTSMLLGVFLLYLIKWWT